MSAGFIEFALMNPLSVKANDAVFAMIRQMIASNKKAQDVLKRLLPRAFYKFV